MIKFYKNVLTDNQRKMLKHEIRELGKGLLIILGIMSLGFCPM